MAGRLHLAPVQFLIFPALASTSEVAFELGVHRVTLQRWIADGRIIALEVGVLKFRQWTEHDIRRVKRVLKRSEVKK